MTTFPVLATGAVAQYPSGRRMTYSTNVMQFVDGSEQRFRELSHPVRSWVIRLHHVSTEEMTNIQLFFNSVQGQFGSFTFVDPWDGSEHPDCSFDQETLSTLMLQEGRIQGYLVIRKNTP
jgi:Conserved hypothetical protein 2217 (DUF2460)